MPFPNAPSYLGGLLAFTAVLLTVLLGFALWTVSPPTPLLPNQAQQYRVRKLTAVPFLIAIGWLLLLYRVVQYYETFRFVPSRVVAIRVTRQRSESSTPTGDAIELTDRQVLTAGLQYLNTASAHIRNHEGFYDGYHIDLRTESEAEYGTHAVQVFRRSSNQHNPVPIVIVADKEYTCPTFHQWIAATIDPLFNESE